jgi:hypothetical protein
MVSAQPMLSGLMQNSNKVIIALLALITTTVIAAKWEIFSFPGAPGNVANPAFFEGNQITSLCCSSDGKTLYVGQNQLLWKSTDGGETWLVLKK